MHASPPPAFDHYLAWIGERALWPSGADLARIADAAPPVGRPTTVLIEPDDTADIFDGSTKSTEALSLLVEFVCRRDNGHVVVFVVTRMPERAAEAMPVWCLRRWPKNLWIGLAPGASSHDQQGDIERTMEAFLALRAPHRFLYLVPLRGAVHLEIAWCPSCGKSASALAAAGLLATLDDESDPECAACEAPLWETNWCLSDVEWVIVGGRRDGTSTSTLVTEIHEVIARCEEEAVPVFVTSIGDAPTTAPDGTTWAAANPYAEDWLTWPDALRRWECPAAIQAPDPERLAP